MSKHVSPERWGELAAGRLSERVRDQLEAHAASCSACGRARERVLGAHAAMRAMRDEDPMSPAAWDRLDARMHWTVQKSARESGRHPVLPRRRPWLWVASTLGVAALVAGTLALWPRATVPLQPIAMHVPALPPVPASEPPARALPLEGVVTLIEGQALVDGKPLTMGTALHAGAHLATADGRVHVQFGEGTAFVLEPRSVLELEAFDSRDVALRVEGAVDVTVSHRAPEQRFAVLVQGRRVEVRGTIFRVSGTSQGLGVQVVRGKVAVMDGATTVDVPAGLALAVPPGAALAGAVPRPLPSGELARAAEQMRATTLKAFSEASRARAASGVVSVKADRGQAVSFDDVPVGKGDLQVRLEPGRYLLRIGKASRWVDLEGAAAVDVPSLGRAAPQVDLERVREVEQQTAKYIRNLRACAAVDSGDDDAAKVTVVVDITVGKEGNVSSVAPVGSGDSQVQDCVLEVIRNSFSFDPGSSGTIRKSIRL